MISNVLRAETAEKHKELESLMFVNEIMNNSLTIENYKKLLIINYIIHDQLEHKLSDMLDTNVGRKLEMNNRFKLSALENDLNYWEINSLTLPEPEFDLFVPQNKIPAILGALYVLEGATLGGNVIKKHILANPNFAGHENGLNYYGVYGDEIGSKWKTFVSVLNESVSEADYEACIFSADQMFNNLINLSKQFKKKVSI